MHPKVPQKDVLKPQNPKTPCKCIFSVQVADVCKKKVDPTESRTPSKGFKVLCANRYTMGTVTLTRVSLRPIKTYNLSDHL